MKNNITVFVTFVMLFVTSFLANVVAGAQNVYQVSDDELIVSREFNIRKPVDIPAALSDYVEKTGYVEGTLFIGKTRYFVDVISPVLYTWLSNYAKAQIHIQLLPQTYGTKLTITCGMVNTFFPNTQLEHFYNPTEHFPVADFYDQRKTYIDKDGLQKVFDALVKYMNKTADGLIKTICSYEPGVYL